MPKEKTGTANFKNAISAFNRLIELSMYKCATQQKFHRIISARLKNFYVKFEINNWIKSKQYFKTNFPSEFKNTFAVFY